MNNLERKFKEYAVSIDIPSKIPTSIDFNGFLHDLTEIAEKDYEEKLIKTDHNIHKMPHKFKHFELFGMEIAELQKENTEIRELNKAQVLENAELRVEIEKLKIENEMLKTTLAKMQPENITTPWSNTTGKVNIDIYDKNGDLIKGEIDE